MARYLVQRPSPLTDWESIPVRRRRSGELDYPLEVRANTLYVISVIETGDRASNPFRSEQLWKMSLSISIRYVEIQLKMFNGA
jgi:hypothetical protein